MKKGIKKEEAEAIKEKLAKVGGVVAIENARRAPRRVVFVLKMYVTQTNHCLSPDECRYRRRPDPPSLTEQLIGPDTVGTAGDPPSRPSPSPAHRAVLLVRRPAAAAASPGRGSQTQRVLPHPPYAYDNSTSSSSSTARRRRLRRARGWRRRRRDSPGDDDAPPPSRRGARSANADRSRRAWRRPRRACDAARARGFEQSDPVVPVVAPESTARIDANNAAPTSEKSRRRRRLPPDPPDPPAAAAAAASRDATSRASPPPSRGACRTPLVPARPNISATASTVCGRSSLRPPSVREQAMARRSGNHRIVVGVRLGARAELRAARAEGSRRRRRRACRGRGRAVVRGLRSITAEGMGTTSARTTPGPALPAHAPTDATALPTTRGEESVPLDSISARREAPSSPRGACRRRARRTRTRHVRRRSGRRRRHRRGRRRRRRRRHSWTEAQELADDALVRALPRARRRGGERDDQPRGFVPSRSRPARGENRGEDETRRDRRPRAFAVRANRSSDRGDASLLGSSRRGGAPRDPRELVTGRRVTGRRGPERGRGGPRSRAPRARAIACPPSTARPLRLARSPRARPRVRPRTWAPRRRPRRPRSVRPGEPAAGAIERAPARAVRSRRWRPRRWSPAPGT